ncbi:YdeI family protein [Herbiconiux sp. P15]|uniref:YdeI/OmpD-associated family protein n=1 Tax=Herbiconiux liukaitaii TaxID=3342799 RepID=UPI0035B9301E
MAEPKPEYEHLQFDDDAGWDAWLTVNGGSSEGVRLRIAKKSSAHTTPSYVEALDVALCHGWIDGRRNAFDDDFFLQTFTPRRAKSMWSTINQEKVAVLIEAGRMREAGFREIERAKADGRWEAAYAPASSIEVPPEFAAALEVNPEAAAFFATLTGSPRYAFLLRLHHLKRPETRTRRIAEYIALLTRHETLP